MTPEGEKQLRRDIAEAILDTIRKYGESSGESALAPKDVMINAIGDVMDFSAFLAVKYNVSAESFIRLCMIVLEERYGFRSEIVVEDHLQ